MNGEIVSGVSGESAPNSFQFFVRPSLIEFACSGVPVRLKNTAKEFPSCGAKLAVVLSVYIPSSSDQSKSLNAVLSMAASLDQVEATSVSFRYVASSAPLVKTC